ncbi:hypothetical protein CNY89_30340, partial [Amaricoccus sp. HAR-UPW-R2A-40]
PRKRRHSGKDLKSKDFPMKPLLMLAVVGTSMLAGTAGFSQDASAEDLLETLKGVAPADLLQNATLVQVSA